MTEAILPSLEKFRGNGSLWEPCCGDGAIARELVAHRHSVLATDIANYGFEGQAGIADFLSIDRPPLGVSAIITNPPYNRSLCPAIVRHAVRLMKPVGGSVFMLLRHNWDTAKGRQDLYKFPFVAKHTMLWRPRWFDPKPGDSTPMHAYSWFEWDWSASPETWPVNHYISRKGK